MTIRKPRRLLSLLLTFVLAVGLFVASPLMASAVTIDVTSNADSGPGSLRQALIDAGNNDIINIQSGLGTISLTSGNLDFSFSKTITINGIGSGATIDGSGITTTPVAGGILNINNNTADVTISGVTFVNGEATQAGGAISNVGTLSLEDCVFTDNTAVSNGGAIHSTGTLSLEDCAFTGNTATGADGRGGAVDSSDFSVTTISGTAIFSGNTAVNGGAIYCSPIGATLTNSGTINNHNDTIKNEGTIIFDSTDAITNPGTWSGAPPVYTSTLTLSAASKPGVGYDWVYNPGGTSTLTLTEFELSTSIGNGIEFDSSVTGAVTIVLVGNRANIVTGTNGIAAVSASSLTISGGSALTATGTAGSGIVAAGSITFTGGAVIAMGSASGIAATGGDITIDTDSSVYATGTAPLFAGGGVNTTRGLVFTGTTPGTVTGAVYGNVTLQDDLTINFDVTIDSGATVTIPSGKTLTIAGGKTLTNNGRLCNDGTIIGTVSGNAIEYYLTIASGGTGGTVSDYYAAAALVNIDAGTKSGYIFAGWTSADGVTFADAFSYATTFTMPAKAVTVTATWTPDKTALDAALATARGIHHGGVNTTAAWTNFVNAVNAAKTVSGNAAATKTEVDDATVALNAAILALKHTDNGKSFESGVSKHQIGSTDNLVHIIAHDYALHTGVVSVDGNTLTLGLHYTSAEGSTRTTLLASYLNTLSVGTHTLTVEYANGTSNISDSFEILAASVNHVNNNGGSPRTGDDMNFALLTLLCGAALAMLTLILALRRKANRQNDGLAERT